MFRILEAQAPAKQNATDTIATLSGRLQSATLLEDRRAAILGLRSFAKQYPASVASGALRNLIHCLSNDGEDVDTTKIVLETLLMLFSPDESSPEASDDIALWLADEFTQRQDNITVLLDLLDRNEFFCRLYSLQLISAISMARPERTQECVYTAPLGVSRLVAILDDKREALRTEALLLLTALTPASPDLQKLVAFENAFERIFAIIEAEGSLTNGGVVVQDCLSLLANLLRLNASNQSFFRETGGVPKIAAILAQALKDEASPDAINEWNAAQRDKNLWGFLSVIRLFLLGGSVGTQMNQSTFWQSGVVFQVLEIGFHPTLAAPIRAEALHTCADLIRGNSSIQERFSQRDVTFYIEVPPTPITPAIPKTNGQARGPTPVVVNVIQGLLDLALAVSCPQPFDVRLAACECIKAYLHGHNAIRTHFLQHARDGHESKQNQPDNVLSILLDDSDPRPSTDPYRHWIAAVILFHLVYENYETKNIAMGIAEGDASKGEEVVTCIQGLTANLISKAQRGDDRVAIGYLMVLSGWLYEDPDAVNDFLQEGSSVQALIQIILQPGQPKALEAGLCAFLLGIIYEFSSKDSPIPRATLHDILTSRLGRDQFNDKMTKLREHPYVRDFEVLPQGVDSDGAGGMPSIYFDKTFVDFLKDNFSRVYRAFDRDPNIEVSVTVGNGVQKGISRELVDSLKAQLDEQVQALQKAESEKLTLERKLGQEQADHRRAKESAAIELSRIKNINDSLQRNHDDELLKLREEQRVALNNTAQHIETMRKAHEGQVGKMQKSHEGQLAQMQKAHEEQVEKMRKAHEEELTRLRADNHRSITETAAQVEKTVASIQAQARKIKEENEAVAAKVRTRHEAEIKDVKESLAKAERQLAKAGKDHAQDLRTATEEYVATRGALEARLRRSEEKADEAEARARDAREAAAEKEEARKTAQAELDDLLMLLADLEEKRAKDKKRLKALGEEVSDGEDDDEEEDEEGEDDE